MEYTRVAEAVFIERPNRFIARIFLDGREEIAHVKNTGRCRELLVPGARIIVECHDPGHRKTLFSLIAVYKAGRLISLDSQAPNQVVWEALQNHSLPLCPLDAVIRRDATFGLSRLDLYYESTSVKGYIEIKGVTLEENNVAMFPDAPTQRGTRHIHELIRAASAGCEAWMVFLVQMKGTAYFTPHPLMDPAFREALAVAARSGVGILAFDALVAPNCITLADPVPVRLPM